MWVVVRGSLLEMQRLRDEAGDERVYCPVIRIERRGRARRKTVRVVQAFPGYGFLQISSLVGARLFPDHVITDVSGRPMVVSDREIRETRENEDAGFSRYTEEDDRTPSPGQSVRVTEGILSGSIGRVIRVDGDVVEISLPSWNSSIKISAFLLSTVGL